MLDINQPKEEYNMYETYREQVAIQSAPSIQGAANAQSNAALNLVKSFNQAAQGVSNVIQVEGAIQEKEEIGDLTKEAKQNISEDKLVYKEGETKAVNAYNNLISKASYANQENDLKSKIDILSQEYLNDVSGFNAAAEEAVNEAVSNSGNLDIAANLRIFGNDIIKGNSTVIVKKEVALKKEAASSELLLNMSNSVDDMLNNARYGDSEVAVKQLISLENTTQAQVEAGDISPAQRNSIINNARTSLYQQTYLGDYEDVAEGSVTEARAFIDNFESAASEGLNPEEKDSLIGKMKSDYNRRVKALEEGIKVNTKEYEAAETLLIQQVTVAASAESGVPLNVTDREDKAAVNATFNASVNNFTLTSEIDRKQGIDISVTTGIVPDVVKSRVSTAVNSINPEVAVVGAAIISDMTTRNPELLSQFSSKDLAFSERVLGLTQGGMLPEEAIKETRDWLKKDNIERRKELGASYATNEFNETSKLLAQDFIDEEFSSIFSSEPEVTRNLEVDTRLILDTNLTNTGDMNAAMALTKKQLKNKYTVTYVNGYAEITSNSPEKMLLGSNEPNTWLEREYSELKKDIILRENINNVAPLSPSALASYENDTVNILGNLSSSEVDASIGFTEQSIRGNTGRVVTSTVGLEEGDENYETVLTNFQAIADAAKGNRKGDKSERVVGVDKGIKAVDELLELYPNETKFKDVKRNLLTLKSQYSNNGEGAQDFQQEDVKLKLTYVKTKNNKGIQRNVWQVSKVDEYGLLQPVMTDNGTPMYWTADYKTSPEYRLQQEEAQAEQDYAQEQHLDKLKRMALQERMDKFKKELAAQSLYGTMYK